MQPKATASRTARSGTKLALVLFMLITVAVGGPVSFSQNASPAPGAAPAPTPEKRAMRKFSIGYLPEGSDVPGATARMEDMQRILTHRDDYRAALAAAGYNGVILSPCEHPRDMIQRMVDGEFDLIFATAMVYAQRPWPDYEPILQFKLPGDFLLQAADPDSGMLRPGVIFAGPSSPLFSQKADPTREDLRRLFSRVPLAVPSADSAAGYLSPRYLMVKELGLQTILTPLFCGSDSEVVKHVVSGLLEVGACRKEVLKELVPDDRAASFYRILRTTDLMPTDPILLRRELLPVNSVLGVKLKALLHDEIFKQPELTVATASPRNYETLAKKILEIQKSRTATAPAEIEVPAATPAPAVPAVPTPSPTPVLPIATPRPALPSPPPAAPTPEVKPVLPPMATPPTPARPNSETDYAPPAGRPGVPTMGSALPPVPTPAPPTPEASAPRPALPPSPGIQPAATPEPSPQPALPPARGGV